METKLIPKESIPQTEPNQTAVVWQRVGGREEDMRYMHCIPGQIKCIHHIYHMHKNYQTSLVCDFIHSRIMTQNRMKKENLVQK